MDFRSIITILKGDVVGHPFHGNQWLTVDGKFNYGGGNDRPVAPKPKLAPAVSGLGRFIALKTGEVSKKLGNVVKMGGAFNKGWQKVEMKDGSIAGIKTAFCAPQYGGEAQAKNDIQNEILAAAVGKVLDFPIRDALPVDGHPDQCVSPWIEGSPVGKGAFNADVSTDDQPEIDKLRFFDQLVGNADRFSNDGDILNPANIMRNAADGHLVGIDHAMAFEKNYGRYGGPPDFSLLGNPSQGDINKMFASLTTLEPVFIAAGRTYAYNNMMDRFRTGFINYVPA